MTEKDLLIQDLRRENEALRKELEWKDKVIELAQRHETIIHEPTKSEFRRMAIQLGYEQMVRCKDCKHYRPQKKSAHWENRANYCNRIVTIRVQPYDFCSYGERKDGDD